MEVPLACTLDAASTRSQVGEWRSLLPRVATRVRRVAPDLLELCLHPDLLELRTLTLLAQREKACCGFFDFTVRVEADAVTFAVRVPADAVELLDAMASLVSND